MGNFFEIIMFLKLILFISIGLIGENALATQMEQIVDYISLPYREIRNVTCFSHETKFTCDCDNSDENMNLTPLSGQAYQISVSNCKSLVVEKNFLENLQGLRQVTFSNVENLILKENSLSFPMYNSNVPPVLKFNQVQIEKIESHAINGKIAEIIFTSGTIATIRPYGITTRIGNSLIDNSMIKFESMFIDRIEPQAFKKFTIDKLEIINSVITSNLPTRSFYDIKITNNLKIHNVTFKEIHTNAIMLEDVSKLIITDSNFEATDGEFILSPIKSSILIENNNFGLISPIAFNGLTVHKDYKQSENQDLRFFKNKIHQSESIPLPLKFNERFNLNLKNLYYLNQYPCHYSDNKKLQDKSQQQQESFYSRYSDTIYFLSRNNNETLSVRKLIESECSEISYLPYIIGGSIALLLLIILIAILILYCVIKRRKEKNQKLDIVVPEPRTYKETQIVLQIENAGLLKTDL